MRQPDIAQREANQATWQTLHAATPLIPRSGLTEQDAQDIADDFMIDDVEATIRENELTGRWYVVVYEPAGGIVRVLFEEPDAAEFEAIKALHARLVNSWESRRADWEIAS